MIPCHTRLASLVVVQEALWCKAYRSPTFPPLGELVPRPVGFAGPLSTGTVDT
jgi:hypothetical protein